MILTAAAVLRAGASSAIVIAAAVDAARSVLHDPWLAARMGSEAIKFPRKPAYVLTFSVVLGWRLAVGVNGFGRRLHLILRAG